MTFHHPDDVFRPSLQIKRSAIPILIGENLVTVLGFTLDLEISRNRCVRFPSHSSVLNSSYNVDCDDFLAGDLTKTNTGQGIQMK